MPMEIVVTSGRWKNDPASRSLVEYLQHNQAQLGLQDSVLYYDFPAYADYEISVIRPDVLLFSPSHGFVALRFLDDTLFQRSPDSLGEIDEALGDFTSNLYSRLLRSRELRSARTRTIVDVHPVIFVSADQAEAALSASQEDIESKICSSLEAVAGYLAELASAPLAPEAVAEIRSVVEGAKALSRPQKRVIQNPAQQPLAVLMSALENEIANFDEKQRHIALVDVGGPARIRGLAGSGKTVILAMKAAHLHLNNPDANILFTFYTKSLRATIKSMITKFYRHYSETDPNWKVLHIRHGWGGASVPGVYSDACRRANRAPLNFSEASRIAVRGETAFGAVCKELLENGYPKPFYDHVLIDEGQDFPDSFYRLCYTLTIGERDKKSIVWAYDELQDILNVKIRQPDELFGRGADGLPLVDLDRSSTNVPPGATNDAVLSKAYRNQRDVLVTAHAMGFGVYGTIVQMLESAEHWEDVGYDVLTGPLVTGEPVQITRPERNSPIQMPEASDFPLMKWNCAVDLNTEIKAATEEIRDFVGAGLAPEEILVISLDDRHAKTYLSGVAEQLALMGIASNNVIADPYNEPPFTITGKVSLSTVYRAKGNEASVVFAMGIDAVEVKTRGGRNKIFTAFTRSKAWLRASGVGPAAKATLDEFGVASGEAPSMNFIMPDLAVIDTIQRGFSKKQAAARAAREQYVKRLKAAGFSEDEIEEELKLGAGGE
ncbi:DEAD/DEAH box helicase [Rhizorhabdus wittichii]|uniref:DEAD/DEAH box helicase n=1 Tax=Rhizorhabdus wittichii TaxID=160791 RepID=UPI0002F0DA3D|nr:ATP-binding domain-containing protein [Rhizorhabdus wittichii]